MDYEQLHQHLMRITNSEKHYMKEGRNTFFDALDTVTIQGKEKIEAKVLYNTINYPIHNESSTMYIKKNSRFCVTPYHIHDWVEINYMYSGSCTQKINGTTYQIQSGETILIDKYTPHEISYLNENDILVSIMIKPEYLSTGFFNRLSKDSILTEFFINALNKEKEHNSFILFPSQDSRKLSLYMKEFFCEMIEPSSYNTDILDSLLTLILCELIELYYSKKEVITEGIKATSLVSVLKYIENNFNSCTLEEVASHFGLNSSYLSTLIKKKLNINYLELVQKQKIKTAATLLLNSELSIVQVAEQIGYENMSFFYKKFKEQYGCSPKQYRAMNSQTKKDT